MVPVERVFRKKRDLALFIRVFPTVNEFVLKVFEASQEFPYGSDSIGAEGSPYALQSEVRVFFVQRHEIENQVLRGGLQPSQTVDQRLGQVLQRPEGHQDIRAFDIVETITKSKMAIPIFFRSEFSALRHHRWYVMHSPLQGGRIIQILSVCIVTNANVPAQVEHPRAAIGQ